MTKWQLQDAKAASANSLTTPSRRGPQIVTRRGINTAVVVSFEQWRRLQETGRPNPKDVLLDPVRASTCPYPHEAKSRAGLP
jgi:antitoxin Phd